MTFGNAMVYSLLGISVVFFALIFLMVIIKIMTSIGERGAAKETAKTAAQADAVGSADVSVAPTKNAPPAPGTAGELKLYNTPPRTAAMLMAIVADELKTPINELRFISIKEGGEE